MLKTILVALDNGSDAATGGYLSDQVTKTLDWLDISPEGRIILCHVMIPEGTVDEAADRPHVATETPYRHIEGQLEAYRAQLPCKSELEIVMGDPAEEIIRLANIYHADLIVIGSRGLTGMNRILQGSVSSQVVTDAPCSVLVVKITS